MEQFLEFISKPETLTQEQASDLRSVINKYPYFQSARALYLKTLKESGSFLYNNELKLTAAHTTDRSVLFNYITSSRFDKTNSVEQDSSAQATSETSNELETSSDKALEIGKPLSFHRNERHSFNEWLKLSTISRLTNESHKTSVIDQETIINRFIQNNPKIVPLEKDQNINLQTQKVKSDKSLMTETLARVYLEQKKFSKAIKAYEILSLKYPEKSGFFADQIQGIKILKQKKT